ncbi:MAG TPA: glycosyltransferase family 1 protein, partial [Leptospiraceae bacterium]|nr:glycosyltransferase family 1 protein [Leptospiraceae bacterium]
AHNKKCIVSNIPTFREIGKDKISYLETDSPKRWAEEIQKLENTEMIPKINLEEFSWENSALITQNIFKKLLNNNEI